jgi:hypothetical protein
MRLEVPPEERLKASIPATRGSKSLLLVPEILTTILIESAVVASCLSSRSATDTSAFAAVVRNKEREKIDNNKETFTGCIIADYMKGILSRYDILKCP